VPEVMSVGTRRHARTGTVGGISQHAAEHGIRAKIREEIRCHRRGFRASRGEVQS